VHDGGSVYVTTFTGRRFGFPGHTAEDREPICVEDIAHALALTCRFGGHCREPYSVAQHSCLVADAFEGASVNVKLAALLHDAHEAYTGDLTGPLRSLPTLDGFQELCTKIQDRVEKALLGTQVWDGGFLEYGDLGAIEDIDRRACRAEFAELFPEHAVTREVWVEDGPKLFWDGLVWSWQAAEANFLDRYRRWRKELDA
jgi:hypothetical protein